MKGKQCTSAGEVTNYSGNIQTFFRNGLINKTYQITMKMKKTICITQLTMIFSDKRTWMENIEKVNPKQKRFRVRTAMAT